MSQSEIILEHRGPVNFQIIESLLRKLKKTKEFTDFNKTTGKRVYAIVVECLENILKHSASQSVDDKRMQPYLSVHKEKNKIIIMAGNIIRNDEKDNLVRRLDHINQLDDVALRTLYDSRINRESKQEDKGAGLGFIFMALTTGKINYNFININNGFSYFEIEISLNKYPMRKLIIDKTTSSPKVILDHENKVFEISGESRPPDVQEFYGQILTWLDDFGAYTIRSDESKDPVIFNFNFEYFNSSSGKFILDICKILASLRSKEINIMVNWHFEKDDTDMLEVGKEMSRIVKFPFEFVQI
jgi:hypothetical protein